MKNIELFNTEINRIESEDLRSFVRYYLDEYTPDYFWEIGASSSGKYHPAFSQGEGGLVRHTKAVCMFLEELLRMNTYAFMQDEYKDYARVACILHDTKKYGLTGFDKSEYNKHAVNASIAVNDAWVAFFGEPAPFLLTSAVRCHMGQWSEKEDRPFTNLDRCVHLADYIASRSFIDIPTITDEYTALTEDVPF